VQKYAEPKQPTFEKKVGRLGLPEPTPNGNPAHDYTTAKYHFSALETRNYLHQNSQTQWRS